MTTSRSGVVQPQHQYVAAALENGDLLDTALRQTSVFDRWLLHPDAGDPHRIAPTIEPRIAEMLIDHCG